MRGKWLGAGGFVVAGLLGACNGDPGTSNAPTYHADIRPILDQHCVRCHQDGGLGVGDWTNEDHVMVFADLINDRMLSGDMPPPVSDPECRDYYGSEFLAVPDSAKETVSSWIDAGMPMGDPADDPRIPVQSVDIDEPDFSVIMPAPYTPVFTDPENPGNEYRCFLVDPGEEEIHITSMDPVIGSPKLVHHVVLFGLDRGAITEAMRADDGWDCIDNMSADSMIAGWAPGMLPLEFPDGYTMTAGGDQVLVLQMHYYQADPDDAGTSDLSGYNFKTTDTPGRGIIMAPIGAYDFRIPAGDAAYKSTNRYPHSVLGANITLQVHAVFPHMHRLGSGYSMSISHDDGSETCIVNGEYDFDNQITYQFKDRPLFQPGDSINFECEWNNSASNPNLNTEPIETRYGERTDEEMCFFFTLVSIGEP